MLVLFFGYVESSLEVKLELVDVVCLLVGPESCEIWVF